MSVWLRLTLGGAAFTLFLIGVTLSNWLDARRLGRELRVAEHNIEQMQIDHRDTLDAISAAMDAREATHEQAKFMQERLCRALENDPLANMRLSDDLRLRLQWEKHCKVSPAGNPAAGHSDTGSGKN